MHIVENNTSDESSDESSDSESSESSTDYSSEDSDAEFATPTVDAAILRTIAKIKAKDPSIYESKASVYDELEKAAQTSGPAAQQKVKTAKEKPVTLKDMERMRLLGQQKSEQHQNEPTPAEAEEALRAETRAAFHQDDSDDSDSDVADGLLKVRSTEKPDDEDEDPAMRALVESTLASDDAFLRDFILKRGWLDKNKGSVPTHEQIVGKDRQQAEFEGPTGANAIGPGYKPLPAVDDDEDLEFEDKAEEYETKYNFRFEEGCVPHAVLLFDQTDPMHQLFAGAQTRLCHMIAKVILSEELTTPVKKSARPRKSAKKLRKLARRTRLLV